MAIAFEFDPAKNLSNFDKHGIALAEMARFEWESAVTWPDLRYSYDEPRMVGLGYIGNRLYNVVFVDRHDKRRIISLRKANSREVKRYAET